MARKIVVKSPTTTSINEKNVTNNDVNVTPSSTMDEKSVTNYVYTGQSNVNFTFVTNKSVNVTLMTNVVSTGQMNINHTPISVTKKTIGNKYTTESIETIKINVIITWTNSIGGKPIIVNVTKEPIINNYTTKHVQVIKNNVSEVSITSTKVMNEKNNYTTGHVQHVKTIKNNVLTTPTVKINVETI